MGHVETLRPNREEDETPLLGPIVPGQHLLSIDASMFRAVAVAHDPAPTDFLLVRRATGEMALRELTGTVAVGQQVPHMRVPEPGSIDSK